MERKRVAVALPAAGVGRRNRGASLAAREVAVPYCVMQCTEHVERHKCKCGSVTVFHNGGSAWLPNHVAGSAAFQCSNGLQWFHAQSLVSRPQSDVAAQLATFPAPWVGHLPSAEHAAG